MRIPALSHTPCTALEPYGWTAARAAQLPAGTHPSRVVRYDGASMLAMTPDGLRALRAAPWLDPIPTVGDWLAVRRAPDGTRMTSRSNGSWSARRSCAG